MSYLQIGRLVLGPPLQWYEAVGDPITNLGGQAIPAPRQALRHQITIDTLAGDGLTDTLAQRLILRRQLRSMLNNTPLKLQGYFYIIYSDDPDQNGWYTPDFGQLTDGDGASGLATGWWKLEQVAWIMAGHRRINREARNIWMKDLRTGLNSRDYLRSIFSSDFSALPALQLTALPHGATSIANAVNSQVPTLFPFLAGRDGGIAQIAVGLPDLACISYDRADSAWGASDVIVYDRQGAGDAPSTGPGATWVEAYGPDYAWPWVAATPTGTDAPVLDNGLIRIRYDGTHKPGFRVDVWNGSAYVEQGKMMVQGYSGVDDTFVSASLMEYTPDRAVMQVVLANSSDSFSREKVFITLQRGELSCIFEVYPAPTSAGAQSDAALSWTPALNTGTADLNHSVTKIDSQGSNTWTPGAVGTGVMVATAGTGAGTGNSGELTSGTVGASSFSASENWIAILRCPTAFATIAPYQVSMSVLQAAGVHAIYVGGGTGISSYAYGVNSDVFTISSQNGQGYVQVQLGFGATVADQIMEAENMNLGANTTLATDAAASGTGSNTTRSTRTTDANPHATQPNWPNSFSAIYRLSVRAKVSANAGSIYAKNGNTTVNQTSPTAVGTGTDDATVGTVSWTNPGNVVNNNPASPATATFGGAATSHYLKCTNFAFSLPGTASIIGIAAEPTRFCTNNLVIDNSIKSVKTGTIGGQERSSAASWGTSAAQAIFGGSSDLWGQTWLASDINASGFGFVFSGQSSGVDTGKMSYCQAIIWYIVPAIAAVSATSYTWYDLGEMSSSGGGSTLEIHAWMSGGAGTLSIDRFEAVLVQDRVRNGAMYSGARDQGQAALFDSRVEGAVVAR